MRIVLLALLFSTAPVAAQEAVPVTPTVPAKADDANKKICRTTAITGSRLGGSKQCHTKSEWTAIDRTNAEELRAARGTSSQR